MYIFINHAAIEYDGSSEYQNIQYDALAHIRGMFFNLRDKYDNIEIDENTKIISSPYRCTRQTATLIATELKSVNKVIIDPQISDYIRYKSNIDQYITPDTLALNPPIEQSIDEFEKRVNDYRRKIPVPNESDTSVVIVITHRKFISNLFTIAFEDVDFLSYYIFHTKLTNSSFTTTIKFGERICSYIIADNLLELYNWMRKYTTIQLWITKLDSSGTVIDKLSPIMRSKISKHLQPAVTCSILINLELTNMKKLNRLTQFKILIENGNMVKDLVKDNEFNVPNRFAKLSPSNNINWSDLINVTTDFIILDPRIIQTKLDLIKTLVVTLSDDFWDKLKLLFFITDTNDIVRYIIHTYYNVVMYG